MADVEAELARAQAAAEKWRSRALAAEKARRAERTDLERLLTRSLYEITAGARRLAARLEELEGP